MSAGSWCLNGLCPAPRTPVAIAVSFHENNHEIHERHENERTKYDSWINHFISRIAPFASSFFVWFVYFVVLVLIAMSAWAMETTDSTLVLYRPVGRKELERVRESGWRRFPPRLVCQPIFYPVLSEDYAIRIARDWNTKDEQSGFVGYVLRFKIRSEYISDSRM
jgi:hypothetical protein